MNKDYCVRLVILLLLDSFNGQFPGVHRW